MLNGSIPLINVILQNLKKPSEDFSRMRKLWVGQIHGSSSVKGKAGVLILIHKNVPCEVVSSVNDDKGRLLTLHLHISNRNLMVTNIYAPNSPTKTFFQSVSTHFPPYLHLPLMVGGDFNTWIYRKINIGKKPHTKSPPKSAQPYYLPSQRPSNSVTHSV